MFVYIRGFYYQGGSLAYPTPTATLNAQTAGLPFYCYCYYYCCCYYCCCYRRYFAVILFYFCCCYCNAWVLSPRGWDLLGSRGVACGVCVVGAGWCAPSCPPGYYLGLHPPLTPAHTTPTAQRTRIAHPLARKQTDGQARHTGKTDRQKTGKTALNGCRCNMQTPLVRSPFQCSFLSLLPPPPDHGPSRLASSRLVSSRLVSSFLSSSTQPAARPPSRYEMCAIHLTELCILRRRETEGLRWPHPSAAPRRFARLLFRRAWRTSIRSSVRYPQRISVLHTSSHPPHTHTRPHTRHPHMDSSQRGGGEVICLERPPLPAAKTLFPPRPHVHAHPAPHGMAWHVLCGWRERSHSAPHRYLQLHSPTYIAVRSRTAWTRTAHRRRIAQAAVVKHLFGKRKQGGEKGKKRASARLLSSAMTSVWLGCPRTEGYRSWW